MDNNYCVYRHTAPNGKVYIGITCRRPQARWGATGNKYKNNKHFYNAIQKYGWNNIKHEILFDGLSESQAEAYEKLFIFAHNSSDRRYGYNKTLGGEHGKMSAQTNAENSQRGKLLIGDKNPFFGKKHSEETKEHLKEIRLKNPNRFELAKRAAKKSKEKIQKRVAQYDLTGHFIAEYDSFYDAACAVTGGTTGGNHIGAVCAGKRKTAYGYIWKYAREEADSCG